MRIESCFQCGAKTATSDIKGEMFPYKDVEGIALPISMIVDRCQNPECGDFYLDGKQIKAIDAALEPLYQVVKAIVAKENQ